jgi:hypothetical protein
MQAVPCSGPATPCTSLRTKIGNIPTFITYLSNFTLHYCLIIVIELSNIFLSLSPLSLLLPPLPSQPPQPLGQDPLHPAPTLRAPGRHRQMYLYTISVFKSHSYYFVVCFTVRSPSTGPAPRLPLRPPRHLGHCVESLL